MNQKFGTRSTMTGVLQTILFGIIVIFSVRNAFRDRDHVQRKTNLDSAADDFANSYATNNPRMAAALRQQARGDVFGLNAAEEAERTKIASSPLIEKGAFDMVLKDADRAIASRDYQKARAALTFAIQFYLRPRSDPHSRPDTNSVYYQEVMAKMFKLDLACNQVPKARADLQAILSSLPACDWVSSRAEWGEEGPLALRFQAVQDKFKDSHFPNAVDPLLVVEDWNRARDLRQLVLRFGSEKQLTELSSKTSELVDLAFLITGVGLNQPSPAREPLLIACELLIFHKGIVLDAMIQRQRDIAKSHDSTVQALAEDYRRLTWLLAQSELDPTASASETADNHSAADVRAKKEECESQLSFRIQISGGTNSARTDDQADYESPELSTIASHIPARSAFIDFVRVRPTRTFSKTLPPEDYAAVVILPASSSYPESSPQLKRLGDAETIDRSILAWRKALRPEAGMTNDVRIRQDARHLADLVWAPLASCLHDITNVYISPDSELNFVPFAALPLPGDENKLLLDSFNISYVASPRELFRASSGKHGDIVIIGAPEFGGDDFRADSDVDLPLKPLPGCTVEVHEISDLFKRHGRNPIVITGTNATKPKMLNLKRPELLHVATHGFYFASGFPESKFPNGRGVGGIVSDSDPSKAGAKNALLHRMQSDNPMSQSGIALSFANETLLGIRNVGAEDGLLTAEDITAMDLLGTRLVVVSACQSGLGEVQNGEGVFGLRRAFSQAGAESLIVSLWSIADDSTRRLMSLFYRQVVEGMPPQLALLAAQRDWVANERARNHYPNPFYWAAFVVDGIGFGLEPPDRQHYSQVRVSSDY
jgi:CHAT domain-containing protein